MFSQDSTPQQGFVSPLHEKIAQRSTNANPGRSCFKEVLMKVTRLSFKYNTVLSTAQNCRTCSAITVSEMSIAQLNEKGKLDMRKGAHIFQLHDRDMQCSAHQSFLMCLKVTVTIV